tara:strand:- start:58 stop:330 length:273 start_codon:yes stop_codon:yes gene_type:complete
MVYCINPLYEIEVAFKCDCHGCEAIIDDLTDDYNQSIIRCPALPDGILCNKVLTEDNWSGFEPFCDECQQAYEVFLKHAEPMEIKNESLD